MLGGRHDVAGGRVDDDHTGGCGGVDVDIVHADTGAADDAQPSGGCPGFDHVGRHFGPAADDQRVEFADCLHQIFLADGGQADELGVRAEQVEAFVV